MSAVSNRGSVPLGVDISDHSDEWCAGFIAGQENAIEYLNANYLDKNGVAYTYPLRRLDWLEEAMRTHIHKTISRGGGFYSYVAEGLPKELADPGPPCSCGLTISECSRIDGRDCHA